MSKIKNRLIQGFTLVEMLLVMVIVSAIIVIAANYLQQRTLSLRIDRTSGQIQQILNAGLTFYIANNRWPASSSELQPTYIPAVFTSPWNSTYTIAATSDVLYVMVRLPSGMSNAPNVAKIITGTLPLSYTAIQTPTSGNAPAAVNCTATKCFVVAGVNVPGQNSNTESAISFAGFYHNGACVPAPICTSDSYAPQVIAVPVAVNGFYDAPTGTPCNPTDTSGCSMTYKPLNGFIAYASDDSPSATPAGCGTSTNTACYADVNASGAATGTLSNSKQYFRVCLAVTTSSGEVAPTGSPATRNAWGQLTGTIMVMTRCVRKDQPSGSSFQVWMPSS